MKEAYLMARFCGSKTNAQAIVNLNGDNVISGKI